MSDGVTVGDKIVLENNLKNQLLKGCCQVFDRESGREIAVVGCLAVTIKSQNTGHSPLVYFVHINQILTDQDYKSSAEKFGNGAGINSNNSSIRQDIKTESELVNTSLFSSLPADLIPPGKNFVVKTQTVYEKTVDGEERKVSVSTQGLIDSCDMKAFTSHPQDSSYFKQEAQQEDFGTNQCFEFYDQEVYGDDYNQNYSAASEDGVYYEEHYEPPPPEKPKTKKNVYKNKTPLNQGKKKSNFKNKVSGSSAKRHTEQYCEPEQQPKFKLPRSQANHSFASKLGRATHDPSNPYVVTRSMHECGYPGCGKRFKWKQHLLRHQTEKHGRVPSKKLAFEKVLVRNPSYQRNANDYCTTVSAEDEYYDGEDYGTMESDLLYTEEQDCYY